MKKAYWIIIAAVIVIGAVSVWMIMKQNKTEVVEYRTARVEKGDLQVTVRASGTLQAVTTVQVGTQVSGIIKKIYVDFNSVVKEGQVIAVLDTILLAQAVEDARVNLRKSEIVENQAKREFERTKVLFEQKVMAQADYDLALTAYETAAANASSSRSALNRNIINLKYATIVAPISGVVVSRAVDVGQTVAASFSTPTMFTIANDLTKMQVDASIDEGDIGKIRVDQPVKFTVDAYPDLIFDGTVRQVRLQPVVTQNVVNYIVIVDVPNPDLKLLPGMTANITVMVQEEKDVLKVPSSALKFSPPQAYLEALEKNLPDSVRQKRARRMGAGNRQEGAGGGTGGGAGDGSGGGRGRQSGATQASPSPGVTGSAETGVRMGGNVTGSAEGGNQRRGSFGMLWVKVGDSLMPRRVRTGITDGLNTEVQGKIEEGDEVVTGMNSPVNTQASQQQQNPFAPQMQRGGSRGGR